SQQVLIKTFQAHQNTRRNSPHHLANDAAAYLQESVCGVTKSTSSTTRLRGVVKSITSGVILRCGELDFVVTGSVLSKEGLEASWCFNNDAVELAVDQELSSRTAKFSITSCLPISISCVNTWNRRAFSSTSPLTNDSLLEATNFGNKNFPLSDPR
ncbi:Protein of unknown function, partial [Cotesia congregata]